MDALEVFYPDRMASRILGMGDVLTLIEKAEAAIDEKKALEFEKKLRANKFDFEDYLDQMRQMRKLGPLDQILGMIPGLGSQIGKMPDGAMEQGEKQLRQVEAMICSMTVAGAARADADQRQPPPPDRRRQRHDHPGREPAADPVRADEKDDARTDAGRPGRAGRGPAGDGRRGPGRQARRVQQEEQAQAAARVQISVRAAVTFSIISQ